MASPTRAFQRPVLLELVALVSLLALALLLRVTGIGGGAPYVYHPDEWAIIQPAHAMIRDRDWNPHWFDWPSLSIYAYLPIAAAVRLLTRSTLEAPSGTNGDGLLVYDPSDAFPEQFPYFFAGRLLVAGLGVVTVALTYVAARVHDGRIAAFAGAAFVAVATLHVTHSRYVTPDVPATAMAALVLALSVVGAAKSSARWFVLAGLAAGLAGGVKWNGLLTVIVPLVAWVSVSAGGRIERSRMLAVSAAVAAASGVGMVVATPALLFDTEAVLAAIRGVREHYFVIGHPGAEGADNGSYLLSYLFRTGIGPGLFAIAAAGSVVALIRRRPVELAAVVFIIAYFAITAASIVRFERNLLPLVPFLGFLAGCFASVLAHALADARNRLGRNRGRFPSSPAAPRLAAASVVAVVVALAAYPQAVSSWRGGTALDLPDTRSVAYAWITGSLPAGTRLVREDYTPQVGLPQFETGFVLSLAEHPLEWYRERGYNYAIASSQRYQRYFDGPYPVERASYERLFSLPIVYVRCPDARTSGPCIRVVALNPPGGTESLELARRARPPVLPTQPAGVAYR